MANQITEVACMNVVWANRHAQQHLYEVLKPPPPPPPPSGRRAQAAALSAVGWKCCWLSLRPAAGLGCNDVLVPFCCFGVSRKAILGVTPRIMGVDVSVVMWGDLSVVIVVDKSVELEMHVTRKTSTATHDWVQFEPMGPLYSTLLLSGDNFHRYLNSAWSEE